MNRERSERNPAIAVFVLAFVIRVGGVGITTVADINPDQGADTVGFANVAAAIAAGDQSFVDAITSVGSTYPTWGAFLAPFWLLPGPSELYAQLGSAALGAYAVYNVFLIGRFYHSNRAGLLASGPILFFPSFVAIHSTILRDAAILCGLTLAVRLFLVPGKRGRRLRYGGAIMAILFAMLLRIENGPVFGAVIATGILVYLVQQRGTNIIVPLAMIPVGYLVYRAYLLNPIRQTIYRGYGSLVDFLVFMRGARLREQRDARMGYLVDILPETIVEIIGFAPYGAIYFLFVPFPWMIETAVDLIAGMESLIALVYVAFAIGGIRYFGRRHLPITVGLLVGFVAFALLYGVISANVGTSIRQRQQIMWVLYLFGGIGIATRFKPTLTLSGTASTRSTATSDG